MRKTETSEKRKKSGIKSLKVHEPFASKERKDSPLVAETLLDCLPVGDLDAFRDVLIAHLMTVNKGHDCQESGHRTRTLYDLIDPKNDSIRSFRRFRR